MKKMETFLIETLMFAIITPYYNVPVKKSVINAYSTLNITDIRRKKNIINRK